MAADPIAHVTRIFQKSPFMSDLGVALVDCGEGWCETRLVLAPRHMQFTGVAHAGVISALADHTAGGAATTLLDATKAVVTAEFKISLLRGARGEHLTCRGTVLKGGRMVSFVEAEVFAWQSGTQTLVAKLAATMVTVDVAL